MLRRVSPHGDDNATLWRLEYPDRTESFVFDDTAVVFNPVSWDTHLLNESAFLILEVLRSGPEHAERLAQLLAGDEPSEHDALVGQVIAALADMESLGLVTRRPVRA